MPRLNHYYYHDYFPSGLQPLPEYRDRDYGRTSGWIASGTYTRTWK